MKESKKWSLVIGAIFIIYYVFLLFLQGVTLFDSVFLLIGIIFVSLYFLEKRYEYRRYRDEFYKVKKRVIIFFSICLSFFIFVEGSMVIFAMTKTKDKSDIIMVLGAGLDGDQVLKSLKSRLDGTIKYLKENDDGQYILLSGGKGDDELISEAEAMKRYLVNHGISEDRIILEDKSTSTFENFKYSKDIIESKTGKFIDEVKVRVFTNSFHCLRSYFLAKRLGYGEVYMEGTKTPPSVIPLYYTREVLALGKSILFDK